jgi:glycosyltransferase involved in cell wall biosynthesis/uncharacterized membrane protein YbhN (UPF0104 family)
VNEVHVVVPYGIDDPRRPSGGNVYDRRDCRGLAALGWSVHEHTVPGRWPRPDAPARAAVAAALAWVSSGSLVLVDGLVASVVPEVLEPEAGRLGLVVLLHVPRDEPREVAALSVASAIVVTSQWTRRWLSDHYALRGNRVYVVPPGVDAAEVAAGTPSGGRLLCVGGVTPLKGHDLLLDALATVDDPAWRCVCVGALDLDLEFVARLRRLAEDRGLGDRVCFTGPLTDDELDRAYAEADALVLASRAETYGMVVTEALARGLPVIAGEVGGVPEALGHAADGSRPGLLVPPGDPQTLGQTLSCWLCDPRERQRLRAAARSGDRDSRTGRRPRASCRPCCPKSPGDRMNQQPGDPRMTVEGYNEEIGGTAISRSIWTWARLAGGGAILAVLVWRVGAGPFVDGLRLTTAWALAAAVAITSLTTLCCAWRWSLVAGGLGVNVSLRTAVSVYYRSQFLNSTLPGGVLGDVHRGVLHGRAVGDLGRGLRSVAWERAAGQAVQALLTVAVLLLLPPPAGSLRLVVAWVVAAVAGVALVVVVLLRLNPGRLPTRIARAVSSDLRGSVLSRRAWPGIVLASTVAVMGHVAVFVVAVQVTGTELPVGRLLPLALVVLLASAVPANIAGWGPREGAAAWAFGAVGLSAAEGVTVAVVYGVLALAATLPGAVMLVAGRGRSRDGACELTGAQAERVGGVVHA